MQSHQECQAVQQLAIDRILVRPQVREWFGEEELAGLAQSICENGVVQPLLAHREGTSFVLDDGERRLRAAKRAGLSTVPVIVDDRELCAAEVVQRQLVANCQREELSPMEKAVAIDRLMHEAKMSAARVSVKLGMSPAQISKLLALLVLPEETQKQVADGSLAPSTAYEIAKVRDEGERLRLASEAVNGRLSRDRVARKCKSSATTGGARRSKHRRERIVLPLGEGRSFTVSAASITLDNLVNWLDELLNRIRSASAEGVTLADFIKSVSRK